MRKGEHEPIEDLYKYTGSSVKVSAIDLNHSTKYRPFELSVSRIGDSDLHESQRLFEFDSKEALTNATSLVIKLDQDGKTYEEIIGELKSKR